MAAFCLSSRVTKSASGYAFGGSARLRAGRRLVDSPRWSRLGNVQKMHSDAFVLSRRFFPRRSGPRPDHMDGFRTHALRTPLAAISKHRESGEGPQGARLLMSGRKWVE